MGNNSRTHDKKKPQHADKNQQQERNVDLREQLFNDCNVGPAHEVQLPEANITSLSAIMIDLDPDLHDAPAFGVKKFTSPEQFYDKGIRPRIDRHHTLKKSQVRSSGRGLHVLLKFDKPVEFQTPEERDRWSGIVKVAQCVLPSDPRCPGITAVTRPLGSVNSKNGAKVVELAPGEPIAASEVEALVEAYRNSPVRTVASLLWGEDKLSPCPICKAPGSRLDLLDQVGSCYAHSKNVTLEQIFEHFYIKPKKTRR